MTKYTVTTCDICAQGYERLRNQDEFILPIIVVNSDTKEEILSSLESELQCCDRPEDFDFGAARKAYTDYVNDNWAWIEKELRSLDAPEVDDEGDMNDDYSINMFLYIEVA